MISQAPTAHSEVEKGTHVTIVVSGGPASAALANVQGMTAAKAEATLSKAGFKPTRKSQASTTVKSGLVISSEPPAGTELQVGSSVTLIVSSGPAPVEVPDLTGQSRTAAEATLTNAKLLVGSITMQVSSSQAPETVLSQSPTTGSSVHVGERINLTVAQAPAEAAVPNVVEKTEAQARKALEKAGFKTKVVSEMTTVAAQIGTVLKQTPAGGGNARKGATVTITIGALAPTPTPPTTTPTTTTTTTTTPPPSGQTP